MTKRVTARDVARKNAQNFLEYGPGLRYSTGTFVVARDRKCKRVLTGGLGGMGVGQMWGSQCSTDREKPGYRHAPEMECDECCTRRQRAVEQRIFATGEAKHDTSEPAAVFMDRIIQSGEFRALQRGWRCGFCKCTMAVCGDGAVVGHSQGCFVREYEQLSLARREKAKDPRRARAGLPVSGPVTYTKPEP